MFINYAIAQTSVVQDAKGETALAMGKEGVVAINTKDESISFSYGISIDKIDTTQIQKTHNYIGIAVKGKGKNGLINIVKNEEFQYDGSLGLFYFRDIIVSNNTIAQLHCSADFLFSQFKLYDNSPNLAFDKQLYDNNNQGYKVTGGVNLFGRLYRKIPYILGVSINGGEKNNTGDIKPIEISITETQTDPITGQIRTIQKDKSNAYNISQYKNHLMYSNLNIDFGPKILDQILLLTHFRWSVQEDRKPNFNPAAGLYFTKTGAPTEVVAGIQVQTLDWNNNGNSTKSRGERTLVNIVAGYSF